MIYFITKLANEKKNSDIKKPLSAVTGSGLNSLIIGTNEYEIKFSTKTAKCSRGASMKSKLAQLLEIKRAEYRKSLQQNSMPVDSYAASVKVDFVGVLDRHFHKIGDAA